MPTYRYRAIAESGEAVTGAVQAESQAAALRMLDEKALFPVNLEEGGGAQASSLSGRKKRVRLRHQTAFYSQLADLLRAGVPLLRSLDVLSRQQTSPVLSEVLRDVREDVAAGQTLADSMAKHPNAFADLHVTMVRAGESGGFLEDVLSRIAVFAERQDELRGKVVGSMIYPCILVIAGSLVVSMLMIFVVPELRKHLRPETFNVLSHVVFAITDFLGVFYPYLLVLLGAVLAGLYAYGKTDSGRHAFARVQLKAPLLGKIITMVAICRFCRILGTLLANGVPILQALDISKASAGNLVLSERIGEAAESVQKGETLSKPLAKSGIFPPDIVDMMAVAEESNTLDAVLVQIAETNEGRTARQVDLAVRLLEPILLLIMAAIVLCIALALLLPILTMASSGLQH
ncbi:MAG TPA: type II secretion system F family protein [Phycisphaerae bacterium]|nr:type II secretion system F family protein [Phycisphaerales bacterium]HRX83574.1 type II secretion system F family protein [Phycisphaerae bacterium]